MIRDPALLGWLRGGGERLDAGRLIDELWAELRTAPDDADARLAIRRCRRRELLRIGTNDILREMPLEIKLTQVQTSRNLADATVEAILPAGPRLLGARGSEAAVRPG